ncbi:TPA: hypothetical protein N0F65_008242 [Lagenidium giganteum]|uniref:ABC transporter n=1 Tax=Lagenidium giganteum TaxID=4803 RepID=A0AAV2Z376_9STRA|nr:TPA: hypothetical protein N0F65_008242 [Lagenidium giganteum]
MATYGAVPAMDAPRQLHPAQSASWWSRWWLSWFDPLFAVSASRRIRDEDVWDLPTHDQAANALEEFRPWLAATNGAIVPAVVQCHAGALARAAVLEVLVLGCNIAVPAVVYVIIHHSTSSSSIHDRDASAADDSATIAACVLALLVLHAIRVVGHQQSRARLLRVAVRVAASLECLLFEHAMAKTAAQPRVAECSNLCHECVQAIAPALVVLNDLWCVPINLCANLVGLYLLSGVAVLGGIASTVVVSSVVAILLRLETPRLRAWRTAKDKRLRAVYECFENIASVKLHALEPRYRQRISEARRDEDDERMRYMKVVNVHFWLMRAAPRFAAAIIFLCWSVVIRKAMIPTVAFTSLALVEELHKTYNRMISAVETLAYARISIDRIQAFLGNQVCTESNPVQAARQSHTTLYAIEVHNAVICPESVDPTQMTPLNLVVRPGEFVVLTGTVGSGKSTILAALAGLKTPVSGSVQVRGRVAYCSQTAWLQTRSIRDNILFGTAYDATRYRNVLTACCLLQDVAALPFGDKTVVGPHGINLSGGQQARICLARACYADADVYLLDAPLAAVDAIVQSKIVDRCLVELLRTKTILLCTHNLEVATSSHVDQAFQMSLGRLNPMVNNHERPNGSARVPRRLNGYEERCQEWQESHLVTATQRPQAQAQFRQLERKPDSPMHDKDGMDDVRVDVVCKYASYCGGRAFCGALLGSLCLSQLLLTCSDVWLSYWSGNSTSTQSAWAAGLYLALVCTGAVSALVAYFVSYWGCTTAAQILFRSMLQGLLSAPATFFTSSGRSIGDLLNRFSVDMHSIDVITRASLLNAARLWIQCLASLVVLVVALPEMSLVAPVLLLVMYYRRHHVTLAMDLFHHATVSVSPHLQAVAEAVDGRGVIRAFGQQHLRRFQLHHQAELDRTLKHFATYEMFRAWQDLQFLRLHALLLIALFAIVVRRDHLWLKSSPTEPLIANELSPSVIGLALLQLLGLQDVLSGVVIATMNLAVSMLKVHRVVQYAMIPSEHALMPFPLRTALALCPAWPTDGEIVFDSVTFQYDAISGPVLHNISLHIHKHEHVGIVGRTGAGKTSLVMALFRLNKLLHGKISIDGVNIADIALATLRSRLAIVPQTPLLFRGTLRAYLDPFDDHNDSELWGVVTRAGLRRSHLAIASPADDAHG